MELCSVDETEVVAGAGVCRMDCIPGGAGFEEGIKFMVDTLRTCCGVSDCDLPGGGAPATVWRIVIVVFIGAREVGFMDGEGCSISEETGVLRFCFGLDRIGRQGDVGVDVAIAGDFGADIVGA